MTDNNKPIITPDRIDKAISGVIKNMITIIEKAADTIAAQSKRIEELEEEREWIADTLVEINPSNYDHTDVCEMNSKSVEVILALSSKGGSDNG